MLNYMVNVYVGNNKPVSLVIMVWYLTLLLVFELVLDVLMGCCHV